MAQATHNPRRSIEMKDLNLRRSVSAIACSLMLAASIVSVASPGPCILASPGTYHQGGECQFNSNYIAVGCDPDSYTPGNCNGKKTATTACHVSNNAHKTLNNYITTGCVWRLSPPPMCTKRGTRTLDPAPYAYNQGQCISEVQP